MYPSLHPSFDQSFHQSKLNFEMNKRNYTLAELLAELQSTEELMIQAKAAMFWLRPPSSGSKSDIEPSPITKLFSPSSHFFNRPLVAIN